MSAPVDAELAEFNALIARWLHSSPAISPEEALDLWRAHHRASDEFNDSVAAINEAIADMEAGDSGMHLDQFVMELR